MERVCKTVHWLVLSEIQEVFETEAEKRKELGVFGCIMGQLGRGKDISVQPERRKEENEKSHPLLSTGICG